MAKKKEPAAPKGIGDKFDELDTKVEGLGDDVNKFDEGNNSAGTRVRKGLKEVMDLAKDIRKDVIAIRNSR